jgi:hypothetical protein
MAGTVMRMLRLQDLDTPWSKHLQIRQLTCQKLSAVPPARNSRQRAVQLLRSCCHDLWLPRKLSLSRMVVLVTTAETLLCGCFGCS